MNDAKDSLRKKMDRSENRRLLSNYLTALLARIVPRQIPSSRRYEDGRRRVISKGPSFERFLAESFNQIRSIAKVDVIIIVRVLDSFQTLAGLIADPNRRQALNDKVQWVAEIAERTIESPHDRARINSQIARIREALEADGCLWKGRSERRGNCCDAGGKSESF